MLWPGKTAAVVAALISVAAAGCTATAPGGAPAHSGFAELAVSLVAYRGGNPVKLLAIGAISAFDGGVHASTDVSGDRMTVSVAGYLLSCQRDGHPTNF